jgi:hypothetical protein
LRRAANLRNNSVIAFRSSASSGKGGLYATLYVPLEKWGCSFVSLPTKNAAIQYLDEVGNTNGSELTAIRDFMVHFEITPEGKHQFHCFGELVERVIFEKAYPMLDDLFGSDRFSDSAEPTAQDLEIIKATVAKECERLQSKKRRRLSQTEIGRSVAKEMDVPARLMDSIVRRETTKNLKNFHPMGKPH